MEIEKNKKLKELNSMALDVYSDQYIEVASTKELEELIAQFDLRENRFFILGDGSNTLFSTDFPGLVIKNCIQGIEKIKEDISSVTYRIGGGENWDKIVRYLSSKELSGIENLAFIPGTVGAAPVQNIGAYGQQISDVLLGVHTIDLYSGEDKYFSGKGCEFRYRYSIFKESDMKKYFITHVDIKLSKDPQFDTDYHSRFPNESLQNWLNEKAEPPFKPIDVANAVTALRKYKLPSIDEYGTCGSAFVNPFVTVKKYQELAKIIPDLQSYPVTSMDYSRNEWDKLDDKELVKIPAGRLLDELGWKGKWVDNVGTFERHALCVVTNKSASPEELLKYMDKMKENVETAYGVELKSEIVIV